MGQQTVLGASCAENGSAIANSASVKNAKRSKPANTGSQVRKRDSSTAGLEEERSHKACRASLSSAQTDLSGAPVPSPSQEKLLKTISNIKNNLRKSIASQMVYTKALKNGTSAKRFEAIVPNADEALAAEVFGKENWKCTARTKKVRYSPRKAVSA